MLRVLPAISLALLLCLLVSAAHGADAPPQRAGAKEQSWRIRFLESAIIKGDKVLLGEVAVPLGDMPEGKWEQLAGRELWPAPAEGKPVNMTRPRLQEAVMHTMRDLAPYCLFPGSMALQRGGALMDKVEVQRLVERELTPHLASLPGEAQLRDFRLPQQIFFSNSTQTVSLDELRKVTPGRLSLRILVRELDGTVRQKLTGSVFIDCWREVPVTTEMLHKEDLLEPGRVTHKRVNLATLRGEPWDGRGGPWRIVRPIAQDQVVYQHDLAHIPTVRKGGMVTVVYEGKTVRLTLQAQALADGVTGETIPLRNTQSKKEIYGVVRDASTVTVSVAP